MTFRTSHRQQFLLTLGDEQVAVHVSAQRRKSMKLQLTTQGDVDLRIPIGVSKEHVLGFVKNHHDWLIKRRQEFNARIQERRNSVFIYGRQLSIQESALNKFMVSDNTVWVPMGWSSEQIQARIDLWLKQQARIEFTKLIERWWPLFESLGKPKPTLRIKKMRTRWGSLSSKGYINLNLVLMQLPEPLIELVVVHELCHLKHFDHGAGFKALMTHCLPDWHVRERELNKLARLL